MPTILTSGTGGSPITSYNLQYDQGNSADQTFVSLIGETPDNNVAVTQVTLTGLTVNTVYSFQYRVRNKHGWSSFSAIAPLLTATVPGPMVTPTFSYSSSTPTSVILTWAAPDDGGNAITAYSIEFLQSDGVTYSLEPAYCDGSSLLVATARRCEVPFTTLRAAPFNLVLDQLIVATINAENARGQGATSTPNAAGVHVQTEPGAPASALLIAAQDPSSVTLEIPHLTGLAAGGSSILYYEISWDSGLSQSSWTVYSVVASSTTTVTIAGLSSGATYAFRYRAQNVHGWSYSYSPVTQAVAMRAPGQVGVAATAMSGSDVVVSWALPFTGGQGIAITSYSIQLRTALGVMAELPTLCDGADATVVASRSCAVPMSGVTSAQAFDGNGDDIGGLGLTQDDLIVVQVAASNVLGTGPYSEQNTAGVLAQTTPSAPTDPPVRGAATSESQLDIHWDFLTTAGADGGASILSYGLEVDDGAGGALVAVAGADPIAAPYTLNSKLWTTAITSGATYIMRYRAYNVHGWGPYSPTGTVVAATVPHGPGEPALTIDVTEVEITWSAPTNTGGTGIPILSYVVELRLRDGATYLEPSTCDGSDPVILAALSCRISMSSLTSATPFGFQQGDEIAARATATNLVGTGAAGPVSVTQTVLAQVAPLTPPTTPRRGSGTTQAQIVIDWDALVAPLTGGSGITSYNLQWDQGTGTFGVDLTGISTNYTGTTHTQTAGVVAGTAYQFRYRAANNLGWSGYSAAVSILAAEVPV
jgi:titin